MTLTLAQIAAAQRNELAGITALLAEMDDRIKRLAAQASRRLDGDHRADFEQDAREALFLALPRVAADSADRAIGFLYTSMADALKDRVREARYVGVDKDAVKVFMSVMPEADGDPYRAAALAQTLPAKGVRLSADRAHAARLAFAGAASLDAPLRGEETTTLADTLSLAVPAEDVTTVRPKVGLGAATEALKVLTRYTSLRLNLSGLGMADLPELVASLEDVITLPADPAERRYVLDAFAILRSAVSTATDGEVAEDLRTVADERADERAMKVAAVREIVAAMGALQSAALTLTFGINGAQEFGRGDGSDVDGFAEAMGVPRAKAVNTRTLALKTFAKRWIARFARSESEAVALADAAAKNLARGGRK